LSFKISRHLYFTLLDCLKCIFCAIDALLIKIISFFYTCNTIIQNKSFGTSSYNSVVRNLQCSVLMEKRNVNLGRFAHLISILLLHYLVKRQSHSLAVSNNAFILTNYTERQTRLASIVSPKVTRVTLDHLYYIMCLICPPPA